jgi:hypothetical protein
MAAISGSYYMVNLMINEEASAPSSNFKFASIGESVEELELFDNYRVITSKPLFDQDRKPMKVAVVKKLAQQKKVAKPLKIQALGIAVTGESLLAVVKDLRTGKISRLRVNDELDGWTLRSVSNNSFVFAKGGIEEVVKFK